MWFSVPRGKQIINCHSLYQFKVDVKHNFAILLRPKTAVLYIFSLSPNHASLFCHQSLHPAFAPKSVVLLGTKLQSSDTKTVALFGTIICSPHVYQNVCSSHRQQSSVLLDTKVYRPLWHQSIQYFWDQILHVYIH